MLASHHYVGKADGADKLAKLLEDTIGSLKSKLEPFQKSDKRALA